VRLGERDVRGAGLDVTLDDKPELLGLFAAADADGKLSIANLGTPIDAPKIAAAADPSAKGPRPGQALPPIDRWRLVLGHEREKMTGKAGRAARALDELYGRGHGEGSRAPDLGGGGQEQGFPTTREWTDEIEALFGEQVMEEVTGQAASRGRINALLEVDPEQVTPSMELLEQILSLKGGLAESHLGRLRQLIQRIVDALVDELAIRVRPALIGLASPRATRRAAGPLHLPRTVSANLHTARQADDGTLTIAPEELFFRTRARRHMDWRVVLIVDVSGSMEPSTIYAAMMGAILSSVPWLDVKFIAFNTEIIDLSDRVSDPLALLLEVEVGGGTHIAKALRYARSLITIPQRTIALLVSDFEEGWAVESMLAEIRTLVESGVKCLGLAALDDRGAPRYALPIAELMVGCGMPVAALTPLELARWVGEKIR
jgi:hypothetical protein